MVGLGICAPVVGQENSASRVIQTTSGSLTGKKTDYGYAFLGIPYAQAERFKKPVASHWEGVRECNKFSPKAFQVTSNPSECSEDCLTLNIYTPDLDGSCALCSSTSTAAVSRAEATPVITVTRSVS